VGFGSAEGRRERQERLERLPFTAPSLPSLLSGRSSDDGRHEGERPHQREEGEGHDPEVRTVPFAPATMTNYSGG
jgi:hypothetical protein